jgi:Kef-type K+ transport system membrane component KefB/voltage-gated potassium channel Kch
MSTDIFFGIGMMIIIATVGAYLSKYFKQPLIPAYIIAGIIIGPIAKLITSTGTITTLAEIGIAFLLFIVGLEINFNRLKNVTNIAVVGGTIQMLTLFIAGFIVANLLGFSHIESFFFGLIITFSSTMVVVKLLSDKNELDTLHGRLVLGFLLMEDIMAIFAISFLTTLSQFSVINLYISIVKGVLVVMIAYLSSKLLFPQLFKFAAKSREILFLASVSTCFVFALLFKSMGFSIIIGAFVAGVILGNLPYHIEIIGMVTPLRDFFAIIFFVSLGMELVLDSIYAILPTLLIFLAIILLFKPVLTMVICSLFAYKKRPSFLSAMTLAQTSEFSLIIIAQGMILGQVSKNIFTFTIVLAVATIAVTSYLVKYEDSIYRKLSGHLKIFEKLRDSKHHHYEYLPEKETDYEIVLCGYNRIGYSVVNTLKRLKKKFLIIDFNPETIRNLMEEKVPCLYGDAGDLEVLKRINFKRVKMLISTVPNKHTNLYLIKKVKQMSRKTLILVTGSQIEDALELYDRGADYVILPHLLGGDHVSLMMQEIGGDIRKVIKTKITHIKELQKRNGLGHDHSERRRAHHH